MAVSTSPPKGATGVVLAFVNRTPRVPLTVHWVDYHGKEVQYATIQPGTSYQQATWSTHPWRVRSALDATLLAEYVGACATITVAGDGASSIAPGLQRADPAVPVAHPTDPGAGLYRQRASACGIPICAFDCVSQDAVDIAARTLQHLLADVHHDVIGRMVEFGASVAVIGRCQVTTDIPAHAHLKGQHCTDGRDFDAGTRGLGGSLAIPVTSVSEENLTMQGDARYPSESILVHEFAHAVMCLGLHDTPQRRAIDAAYAAAIAAGLYDPGSYIASNSDEYWAEATQAWFHATVRMKVTSGLTTREAVKERDPRLAAVLAEVWGDGRWRFTDTAPALFRGVERRPQQQPQRRQQSQRQSMRRRRGWWRRLLRCLT